MMSRLVAETIAIATLCLLQACLAKCPPDDPNDSTVVQWIEVQEENFDRNFSIITSVGKRPLGFQNAIWYYNMPDMPNPCIRVNGTTNRRIEIMFQTSPPARLCYQYPGIAAPQCSIDTSFQCIQSPGEPTYFEFICDRMCAEADVNFWYRFSLSPSSDTGIDTELWCFNRDADQFPRSLLTAPSGVTFPNVAVTTDDVNGVTAFVTTDVILLVVMATAAIVNVVGLW